MKKHIVLNILLGISYLYAQNLHLGIRTEVFAPLYAKTEVKSSFNLFMPPNIYGVLAIKPIENFHLDFRPGISFVEDYGGFELGSYLKFFASESIYLIAAYNAHFNGGEAHGTHSNNAATFLMPGLGFGIVTGNYSSLELMVFIPSPKEWKYDVEIKSGEFKKITSKFDVIVKIGFGFDWPI